MGCIAERKRGAPLTRQVVQKKVVFASLRGRIPWRQENCIPKSTRVQARGARVLSFVCCAPNDGFSPESASPSGLVQRKLCSTLCAYSAWNTQVGRSWPLACPIRGLPFNRPTDWRGMAPFRAPFYNAAKRPPQPSASRAVKPKNLPMQPFYTTLPRQRQPLRRSCHLFLFLRYSFFPKDYVIRER